MSQPRAASQDLHRGHLGAIVDTDDASTSIHAGRSGSGSGAACGRRCRLLRQPLIERPELPQRLREAPRRLAERRPFRLAGDGQGSARSGRQGRQADPGAGERDPVAHGQARALRGPDDAVRWLPAGDDAARRRRPRPPALGRSRAKARSRTRRAKAHSERPLHIWESRKETSSRSSTAAGLWRTSRPKRGSRCRVWSRRC